MGEIRGQLQPKNRQREDMRNDFPHLLDLAQASFSLVDERKRMLEVPKELYSSM